MWLYNKGKRKGEYLESTYTPIKEIPISNLRAMFLHFNEGKNYNIY